MRTQIAILGFAVVVLAVAACSVVVLAIVLGHIGR